jgi:DNA-binding transcriptional MocR family regulator
MVRNHSTRSFLYEQIADRISGAIDTGMIPYGEKLPSLRRMSTRYNCSVSVVMQAYQELERLGKASSVERSGFFATFPLTGQVPEPENERYSLKREEAKPVSIIGKIVEASNDSAILPLGAGIPDASLLPAGNLRQSINRVMRERPGILREYSNEAGSAGLRVQIARRMLDKGVGVTGEDILITNGCIEALSLALQVCTGPGDPVAIESPVFLGTIQLLNELGRTVVPIPTSAAEGMDLESLEKVLQRGDAKAVISTAVFQNPLGFVQPLEKRKRTVELALKYGIQIIEDDVYSDSSFDHEVFSPFKSFDTAGNVIYCASFSKTLGPGMRIGWLIGGKYHSRCKTLKTALSLGGSPLLQEGLADYLAGGGSHNHIKRLQTAIAGQARETKQLLLSVLPAGTAISDPKGGYYFWVELPVKIDSLQLFETALQEGISIVPGQAFSCGDRYKNCIRISYGSPVSEATRKGIRKLGRLIEKAQRM